MKAMSNVINWFLTILLGVVFLYVALDFSDEIIKNQDFYIGKTYIVGGDTLTVINADRISVYFNNNTEINLKQLHKFKEIKL